MKLTRRELLKSALIAGAGLVLPFKWNVRSAYPFSQSPLITKFNIPLPGLGPSGIPLATKTQQMFGGKLTDVYNLAVAEFSQQIHPDLANPTHFWGYSDAVNPNQRYLAGVIVATRGTPVLLNVTNQLPNHQLIPIDDTMMAGSNGLMVGDLPYNRIVTHLHGGFTPWISDGTPFQWFDPNGNTGVSFTNVPGTNPPTGTATYYYPMDQSARLVWYHDHAVGITRTNAYSGIASALVITDPFESYLVAQKLVPDLVGIPLIIQDKTFFDPAKDPDYPVRDGVAGGYAKQGDLWYPWEYEKNSLANGKGRWDYGPDMEPPAVINNPNLPPIAEVPEFFADTALINGAPYPILTVKPGTFRFRLLNGSQARFWHLNLYEEDGNTGEVKYTLDPNNGKPIVTSAPGPVMYQIGTEGGFLPNVAPHPNGIPVPLDLIADPTGNTANPDGPFNLLLAPAERADILIKFTTDGKSYILYNDAPAPFPGGDPRNDYFSEDPDFTDAANNALSLSGGAAPTAAGSGPNTRTIMKIVVDSVNGVAGGPFPDMKKLSKALERNFTGGNPVPPQQPALLYTDGKWDTATPGAVPYRGPVNRMLTLNEDFDDYGRLIQREGTTDNIGLTTMDGLTVNGLNNQGMPTWGRGYLDDPTETPSVGAVEVWNIFNRTGDTHPIHFHLVNVQIIQRARFKVHEDGSSDFKIIPGSERPPDANEIGWKETVRITGNNPDDGSIYGMMTVIAKFDLAKVPFTVNSSTRDNIPAHGNEYVWHCHILEHEEHDMMRPLVVVGPNPLAVVPEAQSVHLRKTVTFTIFNGTPPYTIISSDRDFPPVPVKVGATGGTFKVTAAKGARPGTIVFYKIKDSAGKTVTATLKILVP